jgi:SAM-dependent methyltransferase
MSPERARTHVAHARDVWRQNRGTGMSSGDFGSHGIFRLSDTGSPAVTTDNARMFTHLIPDTDTEARATPSARERFFRLLDAALTTQQIVRLTLGRYHGAEAGLERVLIRPVRLREAPHLQIVYRHATKDITKNVPLDDALATLEALIGPSAFQNAHLHTRTQEVQFTVKEKGGRDKSLLRVGRLATPPGDADTAAPEPDAAHNREKHRLLSLDRPFWTDLGVTTAQGQLIPAMSRKWRQINRFVEVFSSALAASPLAGRPADQPVRVHDFGCGKGYLTFAVHDWLRSQGRAADVVGVELRQELVDLCNGSATRHGLTGLRFDAGDVRHCTPVGLDVMIALHACDIATDYAIDFGLRAGASIILCSPCCHKEIRPQMKTPPLLRPLLQHGVHLGQEAEMVTDSLRALLLDAEGYDAQVFEFISLEHTNKNKMLLAVRRTHTPDGHAAQVREQIAQLKAFYGLRTQCLEALIAARRP